MPSFRPGHLVVVSLRAEDVPATAHFYRDILGLGLLPNHGHWPTFDLGNGAHLVILHGQPAVAQGPDSPRFPVFAFAVEDLDEAVEHLKHHGVDLPWGIEVGPEARWVMFPDPAGNLIELAQLQRPTQH
jgi:catechol-2,3-dioxygenase